MRDKVPLPRREPGTGSGAQASSASSREVESRDFGLGAFDKDVDGASTALSVSKKSRTRSPTIAGRRVNVLMQTGMMAMLVTATLPWWRFLRTSQW